MKLHTKLILYILTGLFIVTATAQTLQHRSAMGVISELSQSNISLLKERERENALNIFESIERAVAGSLERGEMEKFTKVLEGQKKVKGLLEFSLFDQHGIVSHSSDSSFRGKKLPKEVRDNLMRDSTMIITEEKASIEFYKPQMIVADCVRCHTDWAVGEIGGITHLSFSMEALSRASDQAAQTLSEMRNSAVRNSLISVLGVVIVLVVTMYLMVRKFVARPLGNITEIFRDIAEGGGDLTTHIDIDSKDEIGELARCFNTFIGKLRTMVKDIAGNGFTLNTSSSSLSDLSNEMQAGADTVSQKSHTVAEATEQMNEKMSQLAATMDQASSSVSMVATSAEQMTATINEIAQQTEKTHGVTEQAVSQAGSASKKVSELGIVAQEIGKVTETITEISEQTNLLALNATIEAARAGEAGKGFAVVANEIKELARQTAAATEEIKDKVGGIQNSTSETGAEIAEISRVINEINETVSTTTAAMEEQLSTTKEIANNVGEASQGFNEVSGDLNHVSDSIEGIARDISEVVQSTRETSNSSSQVNVNAQELTKLAEQLMDTVGRFKVE